MTASKEKWEDPWLEAEALREAERARTHTGPVPPGCRTRRDCVKRGAMLFGLIVALVGVLVVLAYMRYTMTKEVALKLARYVVTYLFVAVPPAMVLGAATGYEAFQIAKGLKELRRYACLAWCLLALLLFWVVIPLYFQYLYRIQCLQEGRGSRWHAVFYLTILALCLLALPSQHPSQLVPGFLLTGVCALFVADSMLIRQVGYWNRERRLLPPPTHKLQFSLQGMLLSILGAGGWVSGLVLLLRD